MPPLELYSFTPSRINISVPVALNDRDAIGLLSTSYSAAKSDTVVLDLADFSCRLPNSESDAVDLSQRARRLRLRSRIMRHFHFQSSLAIILFVTALSFVLPLSDMPPVRYAFPCVPSCGKGSHSQRGLSLHQLKCTPFKRERTRALCEMTSQAQSFEHEHLLRMSLITNPPRLSSLHPPPGTSASLEQPPPVCLFSFDCHALLYLC